MENIEQLIEILPPHLQEMLAKRIAMRHPEFLEASILTLASANYEVTIKINVDWGKEPENEFEETIRAKMKGEVKERQDELAASLKSFIAEKDIKRIDMFQELLTEVLAEEKE